MAQLADRGSQIIALAGKGIALCLNLGGFFLRTALIALPNATKPIVNAHFLSHE